jgi:hypothetical protein
MRGLPNRRQTRRFRKGWRQTRASATPAGWPAYAAALTRPSACDELYRPGDVAGAGAEPAIPMKAETFAKLILLEALVDAEIGHLLEQPPASMDGWREGLVARISDLVDEIDSLDAVAAARVYDAVVDFLAELPEEAAGVIDVTLRFKQAVDRVAERGLNRRDYEQASTWAVVLDELLEEMANEYHRALTPGGELAAREYARVLVLLARGREVAERMLWTAERGRRPELREQMDRLTFAVRHQRLRPTEVDQLIRPAQRRVRRYRPSTLTRVGTFVLSQLLGRSRRSGGAAPKRTGGRRSDDRPATA